ncbi:DUF6329 domain-containing protein [Alkaliphilus transvaalensis]|uniref:DUF6329 domain-containing protein n=1 Tax=Alkaliphilus transvaalensis TaxID=114628 RepID=UPI00055775AC|nr:DUF6329 domain-containing protein [Alkaliphilus transvaalensis]
MSNRPRALFGRKLNDLKELKEATFYANKNSQQGSFYKVTKEVLLNDEEFKEFSKDFFQEQPWIEKSDGGSNENGEIRCIRVINTDTGERVLINNEGYDYCRYTALEE